MVNKALSGCVHFVAALRSPAPKDAAGFKTILK
jgi:hypothetical protein